ncbi:MAG TPA: hypothetical protein VKD72_28275 [Gemmataceae bacterium]|nr:hypothetical protein [Gemmataceae bacterium]
MAWEQGPRGKPYYSRTLRIGGKRVRQYLGSGPAAHAAATADTLNRAERRARIASRHNEQARLREMDELVRRLFKLAGLVADATLVAGGFFKHGGEWRRLRSDGGRHGTDPR